MDDWWTELWSLGGGRARTYCGIAQTPEGFAVDVFEGDTCIESEVHGSRRTAEDAVRDLKVRYALRQDRGANTVH